MIFDPKMTAVFHAGLHLLLHLRVAELLSAFMERPANCDFWIVPDLMHYSDVVFFNA